MIQEVSNIEEKKFKDHITQGIDGNIVIVGFPHDIGARNAGKSFGQEYGPDCMRRFLPFIGPLYNPEFGIEISSIKITDYGNIDVYEDKLLPNLQKKLFSKLNKILENRSIPLVIGGSKDLVYGCISSLENLKIENSNRLGLISIQKYTDSSSYSENQELNSLNGALLFIKEHPEIDFKILYFATEKYDNTIETNKFKDEHKNQIQLFHYEEIKKILTEIKDNLEETSTKGGQAFSDKLKEFENKCDKIHLSISLEALNSTDCPGVCNKSKQGLSSEEILEICFQAGKNKKIYSVDITDYCPSSEDYRTGILLCNMIYYFSMGYKRRIEDC